MLQKMRECGKLHKLLKVMTALLMLEAWVLSINGCVANESFLVYLMLIMLADFIRKSEWNNLFTLKKCLYASAAAILVTVIFVIGVLKLNISGDIIISHLKFKAIIVFAGYFFMFLLWLQQKMKITGKQLTAMAGGVVLSVFVFHLQHIISACSVAGYVVGIWLMECFFYQKPKAENDAREKGVTIFFAILFAFFSVAGEGIDSTLMLELLGFQGVAIGFILCMTEWFFLFEVCIIIVLKWMIHLPICSEKRKNYSGKLLLLCYLGMIGAWLPYFLAWYPGILSHDSITQMEQVMEVTQYSNHHPWLHTLLIQVFVRIGMLGEGSINRGVACYTLFSILFMAACCTCTLARLCRKRVAGWVCAVLWCFYALLPINAVFMITMWKDIIFAGAVLLFLVILDVLAEKKDADVKNSAVWWILFGILSIVVCLLRSNGLYAWLFTLPFVLWFFRKKRDMFLSCLAAAGAALLVCMFYRAFILPAFHVTEPDLIESLSVPAQQIARVIAEDGKLDPEDVVMLQEIVETDKVKVSYRSYISDPVKNLVRSKGNQDYLREHAKEYLSIYIRTGLKNPWLYLAAYIDQTKGYWYYKVDNWIYYPDGVRENVLGICREPKVKGTFLMWMEYLPKVTEAAYHKVCGIAVSSWLVLLGLGFSWLRKKNMLPFIFLGGVIATLLIATPVCAEFRYMYAVFLAVPYALAGCLADISKEGEIKR